MVKKDIQDFYFKLLDLLYDVGVCPIKHLKEEVKCKFNCTVEEKSVEDCKECLSEFIINETGADEATVDLLLGE